MLRGPGGVDLPFKPTIGLKKNYEHDDTPFRLAWLNIRNIVPQEWSEYRIRQAADRAKAVADSRGNPLFAWSGGKDSIALDVVMERAGVERGLMGWCDLELPVFARWVAEHKPEGVELITNPRLTEEFLIDNPHFVFPPLHADVHRMVHLHFRTPVLSAYQERGGGVLFRGHRLQDMNRNNLSGYGVRYFNPIFDWAHEEVMAAIRYGGRSLPPCYSWPRGWYDGPACWNERTVPDSETGWRETYDIEPSIVLRMAPHFPGAQRELNRR